jgi:hypothetical protein
MNVASVARPPLQRLLHEARLALMPQPPGSRRDCRSVAARPFWTASAEPATYTDLQEPENSSASSDRSDLFIARQPHKPIFKLHRSGMEGLGGPPPAGLRSSHAAPMELDIVGRPRGYEHVAPIGACTDPCQNPCKVQGRAKRPGGPGLPPPKPMRRPASLAAALHGNLAGTVGSSTGPHRRLPIKVNPA